MHKFLPYLPNMKPYLPIDELLKITHEVLNYEEIINQTSGLVKRAPALKGREFVRTESTTLVNVNRGTRKISCIFCKGAHHGNKCPKIEHMSPQEIKKHTDEKMGA